MWRPMYCFLKSADLVLYETKIGFLIKNQEEQAWNGLGIQKKTLPIALKYAWYNQKQIS